MDHSELLIILQEYGLSEKEAKIYLAVLKMGSGPASSIARQLGLKRVTTYALLQDLVRQGYLKVITKQGVKTFYTVDPKVIAQQHQDRSERFAQLLPEFTMVSNQLGNKPKMEYYEGFNGLKELYMRVLDESSMSEIVGFISYLDMDPLLKSYLHTYYAPERVKRGIMAKILLPHMSSSHEYTVDTVGLKQYKYLPSEFIDTACEINLFGEDKITIMFYQTQELFGVYITSKHLYQMMHGFFTYFWNLS